VRGERDLDARSDVYALGVILYECASGQPPFMADALPQLAVLIHEGRPVPLLERRPDLPPAFVAIVERAMAADRNARVSTARELGELLRGLPDLRERVALDATAPGPPAAVYSRPPPPDMAPPLAVQSIRPPSMTPDAVSRTRTPVPPGAPSSRLPVIASVSAVCLACATALGVVLHERSTPAPPLTATTAASQAVSASTPARTTVSATAASASAPAADARAIASASPAPASSDVPPGSPGPQSKTPVVQPRPAPTSRADRTGLATDPF
jgi:serine/threonine-protein kinase